MPRDGPLPLRHRSGFGGDVDVAVVVGWCGDHTLLVRISDRERVLGVGFPAGSYLIGASVIPIRGVLMVEPRARGHALVRHRPRDAQGALAPLKCMAGGNRRNDSRGPTASVGTVRHVYRLPSDASHTPHLTACRRSAEGGYLYSAPPPDISVSV